MSNQRYNSNEVGLIDLLSVVLMYARYIVGFMVAVTLLASVYFVLLRKSQETPTQLIRSKVTFSANVTPSVLHDYVFTDIPLETYYLLMDQDVIAGAYSKYLESGGHPFEFDQGQLNGLNINRNGNEFAISFVHAGTRLEDARTLLEMLVSEVYLKIRKKTDSLIHLAQETLSYVNDASKSTNKNMHQYALSSNDRVDIVQYLTRLGRDRLKKNQLEVLKTDKNFPWINNRTYKTEAIPSFKAKLTMGPISSVLASTVIAGFFGITLSFVAEYIRRLFSNKENLHKLRSAWNVRK